ncbi:MAG: hypothetical protein OQK73_07880 [Gammaproteobacteria bacterium]|nr:hypothetical protein [Gammaproteobacteria bacterium]
MNIFILNTGRCGSTTFIKACQHIHNFSALHESRITMVGDERLNYPDNHIEADNRLSWLLGRLDNRYGDNAFYIHLTRDRNKTIESFARREDFGILKAYREGILMQEQSLQTAKELAEDYLLTVEKNIALFLKNKPHQMAFRLESAKADFKEFWKLIGAEGDFELALAEWDINYNAS